jgi:cytochrome c oxidase subunit 2
MGNFPFFPEEASTVAGQTDLLTLTLLLISAFLIAIVGVFITYFSFKYREGRVTDRKNPPSGNTKVEVSWIGGLFVIALAVFTWATLAFYQINRPPANSLDIYVIGKQWMWKIQHQEGPKEIDTLHIPLGQPIRLVMTSQDVIHSFYVPAFRLKQDVLPGRYTYMWFQATKTGEYHLFCAEYCGTSHAQMRGAVIVMEPSLYQQWLSTNTTGQPLAEGGRQLFTQLGCAHCHASASGIHAPQLAGVFGQTVPLADGSNVQADENYIRESIFFPTAKVVAGYEPIMPTYEGRITEEQVLQLVAYIRSIGISPQVAPGVAP